MILEIIKVDSEKAESLSTIKHHNKARFLGFTLTLGVPLTAPRQICRSNEKLNHLNLNIINQASELHIFLSLFFGQAIFSLRDLQLLKTQTY